MGLLSKIAVWCLFIQYFLPVRVNAYYPLPWARDSNTGEDSKFAHFFGSFCKSDDPQCPAPPRHHYNEDVVRSTPSSWFSAEFFLGNLSLHSIIALLIAAVSTLCVLWVYTLHFLCLIPVRLVRRYLIRHGSIDNTAHDILDNLRKRLDAAEEERDKIKTELENVRDVSCVDEKSLEGIGMTSRVESQSCLSEMSGSKKFDTKADYVRKCRYLARKLKDSEARMETMNEQVEMAKGIKVEFDGLVEARTELGRQNVALTREKREAKQRVVSLQAELKAAKKQLDLSNDQNALLLKQAELLNLNLKIAVRDKKTVRKQLKDQTDEVDVMREELNRVNEENGGLRKKFQEMGRELGVDDEEGDKNTKQTPTLVTLVTNSNSSQLNPDEKEEVNYDNKTIGDICKTVENEAIVGLVNILEPSSMSAEAKDIQQSLLNLERSVEKNIKLRKYAKSLITGTGSSLKDPMDNFIMNIGSEIQTDETSYEGYENKLKLSEESDIDPNLQETSSECPNKTIIHDADFSSPSSLSDVSYQGSLNSDSKSNGSSDKNSICCFDSNCSVCSLPGCTLSHVSCTDIHCLATVSSCSLQDGKDHLAKVADRQDSRTSIFRQTDEGNNESGYVRQPPARRSTGVERLADIFGNGPIGEGGAWNMTGLEVALGRAMRSSESVFVNAGSQVFNPIRGEEGDGFSLSDVSTGGNSTSSSSDVSLPAAMRRSSNVSVAVAPTAAAESDKKKISCFTRNDETATKGVYNSEAFQLFMDQLKGVTEDPRLGDEDPIRDEAGDQGNCASLCV